MRQLLRGFLVFGCLLVPGRNAYAQTIRGSVTDASSRPIAGAVLQLLDSASALSARALSDERGEYRLVATHPGTFRIVSRRIGFAPWISSPYMISAGATLTQNIVLANVAFALDTIRIADRSSCRLATDSGARALFAVWEQARTALIAAQLTRTARNVSSTTIVHTRTLDAEGRRTLKQSSLVRTETVREPWLSATPAALHTNGYIIRDDNNGMTYHAPGIDVLISDVFVTDHCFQLKREKDRIGVFFEPTRDRADIPEIRGTVWLDRSTAALRSMDFRYANQPRDLTSPMAGGQLDFAGLSNGAWTISRWDIRMPVFERRTRSQDLGGNDIHVAELQTEGGELVLATLGRDTLFAQKAALLRGRLRDSLSGSAVGNARVTLSGTSLAGVSDAAGRFAIAGVLPGVYTVQVRTPSLDSVSTVHQADLEFLGDDREPEIRVPTGQQIMGSVCAGSSADNLPGVVVGQIRMTGTEGVPGDATVNVSWASLNASGVASRTARSGKLGVQGTFRACGVPVDAEIEVSIRSDSAIAEPVRLTVPGKGRFTRTEVAMQRVSGDVGGFAGSVASDSGFVADADVSIPDIARTVKTDAAGRFNIGGIPAGSHRVSIRRIGLATLDTTLTFGAGQVLRRDIRLGRVAQLAEVVTRASRLPASFDAHKKVGLGGFYTRAQLDSFAGRPLSSLLEREKGVRILRSGRQAFIMSGRSDQATTGVMGPTGHCYAKILVNGVAMNNAASAVGAQVDINQYDLNQLEGIEWYPGLSMVPLEYAQMRSDCGLLVLWLRKSDK